MINAKMKVMVSLMAQLSEETRTGSYLEESTRLGKQKGTNRAGAPAMHHTLPGALFTCYINIRKRVLIVESWGKTIDQSPYFLEKKSFEGVAIPLDFIVDSGNITPYMVPCTHRDQ